MSNIPITVRAVITSDRNIAARITVVTGSIVFAAAVRDEPILAIAP